MLFHSHRQERGLLERHYHQAIDRQNTIENNSSAVSQCRVTINQYDLISGKFFTQATSTTHIH